MRTRALSLIVALALSAPAAAQTLVVNLKGAADIGEVQFSPRGDTVAARVGRDRIDVWSLPDGRLIRSMNFPQQVSTLLFARHADDLIVALSDGTIEFRDLATGTSARRISAGRRQFLLAISKDGRLLATSSDERIDLWDASGKRLHTLNHDFGDVSNMAFSPDGLVLASAGTDTNVRFWDVSAGRLKASLPDRLVATFALAFTSDSRSLAIGGATGAIEIVDVATASVARRLPAQKHVLWSLILSPDGQSAGAAYFDPDGMSRPSAVVIWQIASGRIAQRVMSSGGSAQAVGFAADGRLMYALTKGPELSVWAVAKPAAKQPSE
jgi:WD40 repeat protein